MHVEEPLEVLHPDLDGPGGVDAVRVLVAGEGVGVEAAEDVAHPAAGDRLQHAAALPDPETHLEVLAAPDVHLLVVAAELPEGFPRHGEQSARHGGGARGGDGAAAPGQLCTADSEHGTDDVMTGTSVNMAPTPSSHLPCWDQPPLT